MSHDMTELTHPAMGVVVDVPTGWEVEGDDAGRALTCLPDGEWEEDGLSAAIRITRQAPLEVDEDVAEVAAESLASLRATSPDLELLHTEQRGTTVIRVYEYEPEGLGRRVRQVQGLIADVGLWSVTASSPLVHADALQPVFLAVIRSLRRLEA